MWVCVGECGQRGRLRAEAAGARGGVAGGRPEDLAVGQQAQEAPGSEGSGALEVSAEDRTLNASSATAGKSLVTAGGYREGILSPAWDAHEKKKNPAFSHPGVEATSGTLETACFASSTNPTSQEGKYKSISHLPILHVQFYYQ